MSLLTTEFGKLVTAQDILRAQNGRARLTLRANLLKVQSRRAADACAAWDLPLSRRPLGPWAWCSIRTLNVYSLPLHEEGCAKCRTKRASLSQSCVRHQGNLLVDACAGAGGKTLALGAMLGNRGRILALDIDERKLSELKQRARRAA